MMTHHDRLSKYQNIKTYLVNAPICKGKSLIVNVKLNHEVEDAKR